MDEGCEELGAVIPESRWGMNQETLDAIVDAAIGLMIMMMVFIIGITTGLLPKPDPSALKACINNTTCYLECYTI